MQTLELPRLVVDNCMRFISDDHIPLHRRQGIVAPCGLLVVSCARSSRLEHLLRFLELSVLVRYPLVGHDDYIVRHQLFYGMRRP